MLTIRFLAVRDLQDPLSSAATSEMASHKSGAGVFDDDSIAVRWAVQTRHGCQECRTRYVKLSTPNDKSTKVNKILSTRSSGSGSSNEQGHHGNGAGCVWGPGGTSTSTSSTSSPPLWEEEVDIWDKEGLETIEIALLMEIAPKGLLRRKVFRHSITTIEMRTFRAQPENRINLWRPLRCVSTVQDQEVGSLQLDLTYSDDCCSVADGYMLGMFCGLAPLCMTVTNLTGNAGGGNYRLGRSESDACHFSSSKPETLDRPLCEATPSCSSLGIDLKNDCDVYNSPGPTGGTGDSRPRMLRQATRFKQ